MTFYINPVYKLFLGVGFISASFLGCQLSLLNLSQPVVIQLFNESFCRHYSIDLNSIGILLFYGALNSCFFIGFIVGLFTGVGCADKYGRRRTLTQIAPVLNIFGSLLAVLCQPLNIFEIFPLARIVSGTAAGISLLVGQLYLLECTSPQHRVRVMCAYFVGIQFWSLMTSCVAIGPVIGSMNLWVLVVLLPILPSTLMILQGCWIPESPRFLAVHNKKIDKARITLLEKLRFDGVLLEATMTLLTNEVQRRSQRRIRSFNDMYRSGGARTLILAATGSLIITCTPGSLLNQMYSYDLIAKMSSTKYWIVAWGLALQSAGLISALIACLIGRLNRAKTPIIASLTVALISSILFVTFLNLSSNGSAVANWARPLCMVSLIVNVVSGTIVVVPLYTTVISKISTESEGVHLAEGTLRCSWLVWAGGAAFISICYPVAEYAIDQYAYLLFVCLPLVCGLAALAIILPPQIDTLEENTPLIDANETGVRSHDPSRLTNREMFHAVVQNEEVL